MRVKELNAVRAGVLDYIRAMAEELGQQARANGFETLAYILAMGAEEANYRLAEYKRTSDARISGTRSIRPTSPATARP